MNRVTFLLVAGLLSSCGGGGGGSGSPVAQLTTPPIPDEAVGGVWFGTTTNDQGAPDQEMVGVSTDDGRFRLFSLTTGGQFIGNFSADEDDISGSGVGIAPEGFAWLDLTTVLSVTFTGQISERSAITGTWNAESTEESGTINLQYDDIHARPSAKDKLQGIWVRFDDGAKVFGADFTDGDFVGVDALGCQFVGGVSPVDPAFNTYDILFTVSECGSADGVFSGLGVLIDTQSDGTFVSEGAFVFSHDSGTIYDTGILDKE